MSKSADYHKNRSQFAKDYSLNKIRRVFNFKTKKKLKILEIGCADGKILLELQKIGHRVFGMDVSDTGIKKARAKGLQTKRADIEAKWPHASNQFDVIIISDTLEHLYDLKFVLSEARRVLKKSGAIIIAIPNHFDIRNRFEILLGRGIVHWAHRPLKDARPWDYGHIRFLRYQDLKKLLGLVGFYPRVVQRNFMAGGVIPTSITPRELRLWLVKAWPELFGGKIVVCAIQKRSKVKYVYLSKALKGF